MVSKASFKRKYIIFYFFRKNDNVISSKNKDYDQENTHYRVIKNKVDEFNKLLAENTMAIDSLKKKKSRLEKQMEELKQYIEERANG